MQSEELKRKAMAFDDMSPDESIGAFGGSGQWVELCTVRDLREFEAALSTDTEPEGWQFVPKEPTEEMHNAARDWAVKKYGLGIGFDGSDGCYRAMLAAAPASPASKHGDAE